MTDDLRTSRPAFFSLFDARFLICKVLMPLQLLVVATFTLQSRSLAGAVIAMALVYVAQFLMRVAQVHPAAAVLEYRHLARWRTIDYRDIVEARLARGGMFGRLSVRRSSGRSVIYFLFPDAEPFSGPRTQRRRAHEFLQLISSRSSGSAANVPESSDATRPRRQVRASIAAFGLAMLVALFTRGVLGVEPAMADSVEMSGPLRIYMSVVSILVAPPVAVLLLLVFSSVSVVLLAKGRGAWLAAAVAGALLGHLLVWAFCLRGA